MPVVEFKVICSTGTYIRSLANDLGKVLECGGYLSSLRRTKIGEFTTEEAMTMEEFEIAIQRPQTTLLGDEGIKTDNLSRP